MTLPADFRDSCQRYKSYPENIVHKDAYHYELKARLLRFEELASDLFTNDPNNIDVRFRDLSTSENGL